MLNLLILLQQQSLNQARHYLAGHIQICHLFFDKKKNESISVTFKNQNFSVLWLKWTQTMETKQNQTFFHRTYSNLMQYLFYLKILNYFTDFQNQNFSVLWLRGTQTMEMKQNQTFYHMTYPNLTSYIFLSKNIKVF